MRIFLLSFVVLFGSCLTLQRQHTDWNDIESVFVEAPDSIQTSVYWYWVSDHLSKEGVVKDLQAMKKMGINRAFIGNIGLDEIPKEQWGKVKIFSDEWWDILHTALKTATALNIDIGLFNGPGWSQSGGPWIKENQAMRYLHAVDTLVKGDTRFTGKVGVWPSNFQPTHVLAFQVPKDYHVTLANSSPKISSSVPNKSLEILVDQQYTAAVSIAQGSSLTFTMDKPLTARSLTVYPAERPMFCKVSLEVEKSGGFVPVKSFTVDRLNPALNVGFEPYAPVTVSFDAVDGKVFRLLFTDVQGEAGLSEVALTTLPRVERFKEKSFAKMHPTPLPYWQDYMWERQPTLLPDRQAISPSKVIDLTPRLSAGGVLDWAVPPGEWIIMQTGLLPTGVTNAPASIAGRGLEVDKMSSEKVLVHFDAYIGEIMRRIPAADRKSFKVVVQDSYETGGQNWTDDFDAKFQSTFGYDPKPYLPVYYGFVVGSPDQSDRFLWDMRRFVADQVAYEYVGGFRAICHKYGLTTWLENYGHWGFPGEFLQYGGQSDEIGGEFWSEGDLGDIENRAAASSAHIYGKRKVSAESFTAAHNSFGRYPAMFKERGDRFFAEGINNTLLHVYIHQPYEDKRPGVNAWFGNEFNRFNTWFYEMDGFLDYIKRCNYLLQQGAYAADVAYFIGEDAPKMTGIQDPILPKGYAFDYMNSEVILQRMQIKNGRFTLPDGLSYKILVLPPLETIRPELLRKIETLVREGGVILGPKPLRSPSLTNYPHADMAIKSLADKLWGNEMVETKQARPYGKGKVLSGFSLAEALSMVDVKPDFTVNTDDHVSFIHRKIGEDDLYFLSNQSGKKLRFDAKFRVDRKQPEYWDAVTGEQRKLSAFTTTEGGVTVPLQLDAQGSAFVVFRGQPSAPNEKSAQTTNFADPVRKIPIAGDWQVTFVKPDTSSFQRTFNKLIDWSISTDTAVRYFAGTAVYRIALPAIAVEQPQKVYINLGQLSALARVSINGKEIGTVWTNPYQIDITSALKTGVNQLEVKVTNTWVNRLIGDLQLPDAQRSTFSIVNSHQANSALHPAGLLGPVTVDVYEEAM